jgi:hypothetical protein
MVYALCKTKISKVKFLKKANNNLMVESQLQKNINQTT